MSFKEGFLEGLELPPSYTVSEWADLHVMFEDDMKATGYEGTSIGKLDHFRNTFQKAEELAHIEITTFELFTLHKKHLNVIPCHKVLTDRKLLIIFARFPLVRNTLLF